MSNTDPSKRSLIVAEAADRLAGIAVDEGFETDAGATLTVGFIPTPSENDPPLMLALVIGPDQPKGQNLKIALRLPLVIHVLVRATTPDAWTKVEQGLADVKRALEDESKSLTFEGLVTHPGIERGETTTDERRAGEEFLGASITYVAPYTERWGQP